MVFVFFCDLFRFRNNYSVHSAPDSRMNGRMNGMTGIWFTWNRQNMRSFGKVLAGNDMRPAGRPPAP